ncbi:geranylgeranylglycerol-phosphate geranylgeranyltransferase [Flammeovirga yaeyamensis]|nr:geranylgeranylglycerol-phosphate geranylgeranyltransferase [Flammeovirga yaeyamensis]
MNKVMTPTKEKSFFIGMKDFLKLIRFNNLMIIFMTQWLGRIFLIGPYQEWKDHFTDIGFWLLTFSTMLIAAAGYIINDYYDIKIDAVNKPKKQVVGKVMKRRVAILTHTVFNFVAIVIGLFLSKEIGTIFFFTTFWLWLYSNNLKRRAFIGNLSVAAMTSMSIFLINIYFIEHNKAVYQFGLFAFFVSIIREVIKDLEDKEGDAQFGCKTLPIIWGDKKTKQFVYVLFALFVILSALIIQRIENEYFQYYFSGLIIPAFFLMFMLHRASSVRNYHDISKWIKYYMLAGIVGMVFV